MRLPTNKQRIVIVGSTGSGKSVAGIWHLSQRNYNSMPWVVFNPKADELIEAIPGIEEMRLTDKPPKEPGIYMIRHLPEDEDDAHVNIFLLNCWARGHIGLYFDECAMLPASPKLSRGMKLIQTQGRSLHIPTISLSQRPVSVPRTIFSEADYVQRFRLNDERDLQTITALMPAQAKQDIPPFHSWYYDLGRDELIPLSPTIHGPELLNRFSINKKPRKLFA